MNCETHSFYSDHPSTDCPDCLHALLREARDWIACELRATEVELPDAEDLVIRIGKALEAT